MIFSLQFLQFLRLLILFFKSELLVLIGDNSTLNELAQVQKILNKTIPVVIISMSSYSQKRFQTKLLNRDSPTSQLNLVYLVTDGEYLNLHIYLDSVRSVTKRTVLVRESNSMTTREEITDQFRSLNMVMVKPVGNENIQVIVWSDSVTLNYRGNINTSKFDSPEGIFSSNDSNALMFRQQMDRWPGDPIDAVLFTNMLAPYYVMLKPPGSEKFMFASSDVNTLKIIGDTINFSMRTVFVDYHDCSSCFQELPVFKNHNFVKYFDYQNISVSET